MKGFLRLSKKKTQRLTIGQSNRRLQKGALIGKKVRQLFEKKLS